MDDKKFEAKLEKLSKLEDRDELLEKHVQLSKLKSQMSELLKAVEGQIVKVFPTKDRGAKTTKYKNFKVRTKRRHYLKTKGDIEEAYEQMTELEQQAFRKKFKVSKTGLGDLKTLKPESYEKVLKYVKETEGSPSVKVDYDS